MRRDDQRAGGASTATVAAASETLPDGRADGRERNRLANRRNALD
ncbi:hypothetical protein [Natronococcus sp. JC468]|nr:hypothetical protein [Natronococcus sp. JC468]